MTYYRVSFFKHLLSPDGHSFRCLQQTIEVRRARCPGRAIKAAKRRYERLCQVPDWRLHADTVELKRTLRRGFLGRAVLSIRAHPQTGSFAFARWKC
jgi:hypothetical protein